MKIFDSPQKLQKELFGLKCDGKKIGFVPTMGYLHDGHLSLLRIARDKSDVLVASIFVNPTQFGPNEDLDSYPRDFKSDEMLCEKAGVDYLFYPTNEAMYPDGYSTYVDEHVLSQVLCGRKRPGHFRGVVTVVAKLFNIVMPDVAVFGQKDAQQVRVVQQLVRDLNFPVEVIVGPIVREVDGLAMSSRNTYLKGDDRNRALVLNQSLLLAKSMIESGESNALNVKKAMLNKFKHVSGISVDYVEIRNYDTLDEIELLDGIILIAVAVMVGDVRLIDNIIVWN
ncbi:MAG: pantoate--beta-alanine ligase [Kiritimatiellae bacterium]|nr:pantoate--beta-alanine ligase [Kiritimatiellia bacterium]